MATTTDSMIQLSVKHLRVDSRGFLQIATVTDHVIPQFCPFKANMEHCGTWCPHFHVDMPKGVILTCSGQPFRLISENAVDESE